MDPSGSGAGGGDTLTAPADPHRPAEAEVGRDYIDDDGPGRYELRQEHGRGGLGCVFRAYDHKLGREVAVKELLESGKHGEARFLREALVTSRLEHPSIVPVHDIGRWPEGRPFYAMKLVLGRSLKNVVGEASSIEDRLALLPHVIAIADAVAYAHSRGVIHRDLKPSNVLVGEFGETVVIDWGLAKDLSREDPEALPAGPYRTDAAGDLTADGTVLGTPAYMPPEQARGEEVDERADVYALGAILYDVLVGRAPFEGESLPDILHAVVHDGPRPLPEAAPGAPQDLAAVVAKAMQREKAARYASAQALAEDLRRYQAGRLVSAREYSALAIARHWLERNRVLAVATLAIAGVLIVGGTAFVVQQRRLRAEAQVERDKAAELQRAEAAERQRAEDRALDLLEQGGYAELTAGRPVRAAVLFHEAYRQGRDTISLRLGLGEAMLSVDAVEQIVDDPDGGTVNDVDFSSDGRFVVTGSSRNAAHIWDVETGARLASFRGHEAWLSSVTLSRDDRWLLTTSADGTARIWDLSSGDVVRVLRGHTDAIRFGDFSPDGGRVVTASDDETVRVWDASTGRSLRIFDLDTPVVCARFSSDGTMIAAGSADGVARIWSAATGRLVRTFSGHSDRIAEVAFDPSGRYLLTSSYDRTARVWGIESGALVHALDGHTERVVPAVWSPDGDLIATGSYDGTVQIWQASSGDRVMTLRGHEDPVWGLAFSLDGGRLASTSRDGTLRFWNLEQRADLANGDEYWGHERWVVAAKFSPDGRYLLTWGGEGDYVARLRDARSLDILWERHMRLDQYFTGDAIAFSPSGDRIAVGGEGQPQVLDASTGAVLTVLDAAPTSHGYAERFPQVAFAPDGQAVVALRIDGVAFAWNAATGALFDKMSLALRGATSISFHPSGQQLAVGSDSGDLVVQDLIGDRVKLRLLGHPGEGIRRLAYDREGRRIASVGDHTHTCRIWDAASGEMLAELRGHSQTVFWCRFSPDHRIVVTAAADQRAIFWDIETGRAVHTIDGPAYAADFSPDGRQIAVAGFDGYARVLRVEQRSAEAIEQLLERKTDWRFVDGRLSKQGAP